jgi:hypothetical protein
MSSKTKQPLTTLVTSSAILFRHDNILAIAIIGVIFCIQCYDQQSFVVNAFTGLHHNHRAYQGVTKLSPVPTVISSSTPTTPPTPTRTVSLQGFFGGMFGEAVVDQKKDEKKDKVLANYDVGTFKDVDVQFESLSDYIVNKWAPLFLSGNIKLTTDVELVKLPQDSNKAVAGCQLIFKKIDTGYVSKSEEGEGSYQRQTAATSTTTTTTTTEGAKGSYQSPPTTTNATTTDNNNDDLKKKTTTKKKDEKKQGGVEILVEKLSSSSLQVRAKRCEIDDDTMIKEMSEEVIIQELKKAIGVWKKKN